MSRCRHRLVSATAALGLGPTGTEYDLAVEVGELRGLAGERFDRLD